MKALVIVPVAPLMERTPLLVTVTLPTPPLSTVMPDPAIRVVVVL